MDMTKTVILAGAGVLSFLVALVLGKWLIPWLHKLKFGQTILADGPTWHQKKQGTPTMGGILFILGFVLAVVAAVVAVYLVPATDKLAPAWFTTPYELVRFWGGVGLALGCGLIGFLDDYIMGDKYFKIKHAQHNLERTRCQIALAKDMLKKMEQMNEIVRSCVEAAC